MCNRFSVPGSLFDPNTLGGLSVTSGVKSWRHTGVEEETAERRATMPDVCLGVDVIFDGSPVVRKEDTVCGAGR